jgi:cell division protein FtsZ
VNKLKTLIKNVIGDSYAGSKQEQPQQPAPKSQDDDELAKIVEQLKVNIKIIGCGGGGSNTINRLTEAGVYGATIIAANTDAPHLLQVKSNRKILLGKRTTRGLGAGADPLVGAEAAKEADEELRMLVSRSDIVFVTAGMGGGTGTGSAPYVAQLAKENGALVIAIVTIPFTAEGKLRMENALWGIDRLKKYADTTIVIPNDKLLQLVPNLPLDQAFKVADEVLMEGLKGLTEIITKPGLVNLDYSDIKAIMDKGGVAMIGIGESEGSTDRVAEAVDDAVNSPLIESDITHAKGALIRIVGDSQMTVTEAQRAAELIQKRINPMAKIIWGASIDPAMEGKIKVLVVLTGVKSPYILDTGASLSEMKRSAKISSVDSNIDII